MRGIILAGGAGTRLHPATLAVSKQLLPVFDKPMIYYPLSTLMMSGIQDFMIITTPDDQSNFRRLLGSGQQWGCDFAYACQAEPRGIAEAFLIAEDWIDGDDVALILGDNIFHGRDLDHSIAAMLEEIHELGSYARVFTSIVDDPQRYGVLYRDKNDRPQTIIEKPKLGRPFSAEAVTGLYFYDDSVCDRARSLEPSARGELEITDLNKSYLDEGKLEAWLMGRETVWLDAGTPESLAEATDYVRAIQTRSGILVGSPEEAAWINGWITDDELARAADSIKSSYGKKLRLLLGESCESPS